MQLICMLCKMKMITFAQKPAMSELKKLTIFTLNNLIWTIVQKYPNDFSLLFRVY